ncbi:MAG: hypothetical protein ACFCU1_14745 [Sumerlaeia bacterium]
MRFNRLQILFIFSLLGLCAVSTCVVAQDAAPLVRRPSNIRVKTGDAPTNVPEDKIDGIGEQVEKPEAEPDPTAVIVALVNNHTITRAQLDRRIEARTNFDSDVVNELPAADSVMNLMGSQIVSVEAVDEFQKRSLRNAILKEEAEIITEWQEQMMLADEARRHQFLVTNQELQARMGKLEQDFALQDKKVDNMLQAFGMTRAELESYVYDALLIEKLLNRFIELNYSEADFYNSYEANPAAYRVAPQKRVAHFSISLLGNETPTVIRKFKDEAEAIRDRLRKGEDPEAVMSSVNNIEYGIFGSTLNWSTESRMQNRSEENFYLPEAVVASLLELKTGELSRVLTNSFRSGGQEIIESFHVIKVLEEIPATGETFEAALPKIKQIVQMNARAQVLQILKDKKTHKRMIRLSGIAPEKLPTPEELRENNAPVSLKLTAAGNAQASRR